MEIGNRLLHYLVLSFFIIASSIYIWHKILSKKINFKDYKLYITLISLMIISLINYYNVNAYIRITIITMMLMIFYKILFKDNLQKCLIVPLISQFIIMISEMVFVFVVCVIFGMDNNGIIDTQFGQTLSNLIIAIISLLIVQIPIIQRIYKFLLKITDKLKSVQLITFSTVIIIIANIMASLLYYRVEFKYLLVFNTILTVFYACVILYMFKTKNSYIKVFEKYNTTLNSLKEYEDILDKYRVSNHENKNQLLTIRNMLPKSEQQTISYIDKIVDNKLKDNDRILFDVSIIPAGGLRGLIYSKVLTMKEMNIEYELEISNKVKTVDLISLNESLVLDICQIIGVFLDNSIEEVKKLQEKYINIEMYVENNSLIIAISNNYNGKIELDKLDKLGYTSKGNGHGYGLTLVNEIIKNNNKLENSRAITSETFTQLLKIKM